MILGLLASALACPSTATLTNAEATLADAEPALAAKAIDGAMIAISTCTEPIDPQLLARIWLVRGIASQLLGEDPEVYYQAALRADETVWDDLFGPSIHQRFLSANAVRPASGTLVIEPLILGRTFVNGVAIEVGELPVEAGTQVVQVLPGYGRVHLVQPGRELRVEHRVPPPVAPTPGSRSPARKPLPLLLGGVAAAAIGGGVLAWSFERRGAFAKAPDGRVLQRQYEQHVVGRVAGPVLIGVGGAGIAVYTAW